MKPHTCKPVQDGEAFRHTRKGETQEFCLFQHSLVFVRKATWYICLQAVAVAVAFPPGGGSEPVASPLLLPLCLCAWLFARCQVKEKMELTKCARERFGKFFFRFPEGESAADVYDRVTGRGSAAGVHDRVTACDPVMHTLSCIPYSIPVIHRYRVRGKCS